ncbi:hypothetical protein CYY_000055 [Polysphondylium violaceum]|uniref:Trafficking protein particle complex subunit 8 n=1 Tax=Polysphondylium violaceum TaxID=133409 RepID=A0A8J4Q5G8_9MYCE|nr:hypothetical protein CYY_000055 [Polysphondylium violaceum]
MNSNQIQHQQLQMMQLRDIKYTLNSWITPSVLVICSPNVSKIFQKSGNSALEEILSQYVLDKKKLSVRVGESSYDINDFKLNFVTFKHLDPQHYEQVLKDNAASVDTLATDEYHSNFQLRTKQDVPYFHKICQEPTPWFERYRHNFIKSSHNLELETFSHPIACILAVSSEDSNPIGMLVKMFDSSKPPPLFQQYNIDANIPKLYMLVHPEHSHAESDKRLAEMKQTFGSNQSYLLRVNSKEDYCGLSYDQSTAHLNPLTNIINEIISKHIPAYIEKTILELNENIATNKKSFFSKVKVSFRFGGNKKANEQEVEQANSMGSIEQALRKVADLYFILQDYEQSLSNYKTLVKEYNSDKSPNYYASVNEMIGICNLLLNKECESYFEIANTYYQKASLNHCLARVTMIHGDILKRKNNYKLLAELYKSTAERENLDAFCSAILFEQAGFSLLQISPSPLFRKACMRIVMAGDKYSEYSKQKHALRCYSFSYSIYEGRDWNLIDDHLHLSLVRYSFFQGHTSDAILFVNKLLERNCQSPEKQNSIIREFLYISKTYTKENYIGELPIPSINNESISVFLNDYSSDENQAVWQEMEEAFKKEAQIISKPQLQGFDLWKRDLFIEKEKERTAVVEEQITVSVELKNPLQIPLQFNRVHLVATFKEISDDPNSAIEESNMSPLDDEAIAKMDSTPFKVEPMDILLGPSKTKRITFTIQPLKPGLLQVKGLGLCMCGAIWGKREFKLKQKRLNKTKAQRESVMYEPNLALTFRVTSPMPRLEAQFIDFPNALYHGELKQAKLLLKNCSNKMGLKNVRVRTSHPTSICFGSNMDDASVIKSLDTSVQLNIELPPNATVLVPFWVKGVNVGRHPLRCLVYYESEAGNTDLKYRLARCQAQFDVRPSIRISSLSQQSSTDLNAYLLGVEIDNPVIGGGGESFHLKQISSISKYWKLEPLSYAGDVPNPSIVTLKPGQFTNLFFRIVPSAPITKQIQDEISISNISFLANDPMYDASSFPVFPFLEYEKLGLDLLQNGGGNSNSIFNSNNINSSSSALTNPNSTNDQGGNGNDHPNHIDLLVFWESDNHLMGVLNSPNISFLPTHYNDSLLSLPWGSWKNTTSPTGKNHMIYPSLKLPLRYQIISEKVVKHSSFETQPLCTVPVTLQLSNCSFTSVLELSIETLLPHENIDQTSRHTSQYFWTGVTKYTIKLAPQQIVDLQLHACFSQYGVYNINRYKINVTLSNDTHKDIFSTTQHLINIEN